MLIVIPENPSGDAIAAALALRGFLVKLEKQTELFSPTQPNSRLSFLPGFPDIHTDLRAVRSFVIDLSTKRAAIDELSYKKEDGRLSVYIKPKENQFEPSDVTFRTSDFPYDVIVAVCVSGFEQLGGLFSENAELFYEVPVINIDHKPNNENFGQINLVQVNAGSCSEIVFDLISRYEQGLIDENIATALLSGFISETNSFQNNRTSPQVLLKASQLVGLGGRQQDIISHLYKNKSLGLLKLWGRVLARLKQEPTCSLVYSAVNSTDLAKSGATEEDASLIIREMSQQLSFAKNFLFLKEKENQTTEAYLAVQPMLKVMELFAAYQPVLVGQQAHKLTLPVGLMEAEQRLVGAIASELGKFA
ncbi:MAG: DHH family phosphoesterase [Candidatus Saccharibacteria bacterium]